MDKIFKSQRLAGYYCQGNPRLDYNLIFVNEETGEKTLITEERNHLCFGSLPNKIQKKEGHRTVLEYILKKHRFKVRDDVLSRREIAVWLRVARGAKFLPKSVGVNDLTREEEGSMDNRTTIDITDLTPSLLYIYLTVIRMIQEAPAMVRIIPSLVKGYKLDFPSAWVLTSRYTMNTPLHNFVSCAPSGYPGTNPPDINKTENVSLDQIIALKLLIRNPKKYDKRVVEPGMSRGAESTLRHITDGFKKRGVYLTAKDFLDPMKREAVKIANDPKEYLEIINSQPKEKAHGK